MKKKYKKCCLSSEKNAQDDLWEQFEASNYEDQIAIFLGELEAGNLDEDLAFEMLAEIHSQARKRGEYARFAALVEGITAIPSH